MVCVPFAGQRDDPYIYVFEVLKVPALPSWSRFDSTQMVIVYLPYRLHPPSPTIMQALLALALAIMAYKIRTLSRDVWEIKLELKAQAALAIVHVICQVSVATAIKGGTRTLFAHLETLIGNTISNKACITSVGFLYFAFLMCSGGDLAVGHADQTAVPHL